MSIKASLITFVIRRTVKKQFANVEDYDALRKSMGSGKLVPKTPEMVSVIPEKVAGVPCEWITLNGIDQNKVLIYLHGGGYVFGGLDSHRDIAWRLAEASGMRVLMVDYRLAPENPFPAALEDATKIYQQLLSEGFDPSRIAIGGDSAGGGLALSTLVNLRNLGVSLPACGILLSPWLDLTGSGESVTLNEKADPMLTPTALTGMATHYLGDTDRKAPLASPLFADLKGLPPLMVQVGSTEILLSDSERLEKEIRSLGGEIRLDVWKKMPHVWQVFSAHIPEGRQAIVGLGKFLKQKILDH